MSKDVEGPRRRFLERFRARRRDPARFYGARHRGGFEGPENVPPLQPHQVPLVLVDGTWVRPEIAPADSTPAPPGRPVGAGSAQSASESPEAEEG